MNEEILSGLKNAVARGFSLEDSIQSFINAGYNPAEVKEAAYLISKGFSPLPTSSKEFTVAKVQEGAPFAPKQDIPEKKTDKSNIKWIIIILIALVILGISIPLLFFRTQFLGSVIDPIFP
jgi:hypothetical protein